MEKLFDYIAGDEWLLIISVAISLYSAIVAFYTINM